MRTIDWCGPEGFETSTNGVLPSANTEGAAARIWSSLSGESVCRTRGDRRLRKPHTPGIANQQHQPARYGDPYGDRITHRALTVSGCLPAMPGRNVVGPEGFEPSTNGLRVVYGDSRHPVSDANHIGLTSVADVPCLLGTRPAVRGRVAFSGRGQHDIWRPIRQAAPPTGHRAESPHAR
jgi:hypothetical protein